MYENLPMKMKSDGVIKRVLYSLYLDQADADSGSLCLELLTMLNTKVLWKSSPCLKTYRQIDYPLDLKLKLATLH
ncbi:unnamed protein product [Candida parapsilosis]